MLDLSESTKMLLENARKTYNKITPDITTFDDNANGYGYKGRLCDLGIEGSNVVINKITIYKRSGTSPNAST